jgi:hypothetical protein
VIKKEENEKRIKGLRKELEHIAGTNWMYESAEKLTGQ